MKIFFCDNRLGGLLGFRIDIIRHLAEAGHDVCLLVPPATNSWDKVGEQVPEGVRIIEARMQPSGTNPVCDLRLFADYLRIYRRERPDVVFNYTIKPNIYSSIAAKMCGSRVFCMLAGLGYMFEGKGFLKAFGLRLYKYGLSKADRIMVLNQMNYDLMLEYKMTSAEKLLLMKGGEGVNLQRYAYKPADYSRGTTFLMVSRILYDKGYSEYLDAARIVKKKHPDANFELLGPLAYDSPMGVPQDVFERDRQEGIVRYLGVAPVVDDIVSREDVVMVVPSKYGEGLNRSLMEACAIGRPIITTDIPGCRETVEDGANGYLVAKGEVQSLVSAMEHFIELGEQEKRAMAQRSHEIAVERFDIEKVIRIYDELLKYPTKRAEHQPAFSAKSVGNGAQTIPSSPNF